MSEDASGDKDDKDYSEYKFFKVLASDKLAEGEGQVVRAGLKKIALFKYEGELHAIQNFCPHAGGPLGLGEFSNGVVRCPRHYWGFDVKTGACRTNPQYETRTYPTRVEDGYILVGVPDDSKLV
jgi:nitrite reductase/ring-hydroxylating ferredoxin subunit